ncbi:hypothetical protein FD755_023002, partial [Muntiacus reevesi]
KTQCNAILMVPERKIPAHRVFTTNKLESKSFEVELKDAEPDIVEQLSNNLHSLLDAANQYQIEPAKKTCADFLKEQIDASNCLVQAEPLIQDNPKCLKMVISKLPTFHLFIT